MKVNFLEVFLGLIVIFVSVCFVLLLYIKVDFLSVNDDQFFLSARFDNINGIVAGSSVKMAGVDIGVVKQVKIDLNSYEAVIKMSFKEKINLPDDSEASVQADGLLGGSHISIIPGGSDVLFMNNDEIIYTQGSTSLINLMLKFAGEN